MACDETTRRRVDLRDRFRPDGEASSGVADDSASSANGTIRQWAAE